MRTGLELAVNALVADLTAIDGNDPYTTTVQTVTTDVNVIGEAVAMPAVFVTVSGEQVERQAGLDLYHYKAELLVLGYLEIVDTDTYPAHEQLLRFAGDIQHAMISTDKITHSGTVYYTRYLGMDVLATAGRPIQGVAMRFEVEYGFTGDIAA